MSKSRFTSDELNQRILEVIKDAHLTPANRLSRYSICVQVYGGYSDSNDRKIRDAVTELCIQGHPICATSDAPGYYLAKTYQEAEQCIAELRSRSDVYNQKIEGIKRGLVNADQPIRGAVQMGLQI